MEQKEEKGLSEQILELRNLLENKEKEGQKKWGKRLNAFQVEDQMELAGQYLNDAAKDALSRKGTRLVEEYNKQVGEESEDGVATYVREAAICHYFTCRVLKDKVEEGVKAISETINQLADMGAIHSCLSPLKTVDLAQLMFQHPTCAVLCYVHIKRGFEEAAKSSKYNTPEGGIGPTLHSVDIELPPGEFFAECRLTHSLAMLYPSKSTEARVIDAINEYLKFLPEGTELVGYRQTAVTDTSLPYELKFRNPLLQRVKRVELDYVREVALMKEGEKETLKQFNVVTGIRYLGVPHMSVDGKIVDLYPHLRP